MFTRRRQPLGETFTWIGAALLVALALVAGVALDNPGKISARAVVRPAIVLIALVVVLGLGLRLVHPPTLRVLPLGLFLFFLYGRLSLALPGVALPSAVIGFQIVVFYLWFRRFDGSRLARTNLWIALVMAVGTSAAATPRLFAEWRVVPRVSPPWSVAALASIDPGELPDILYVVPDRYASRSTLEREYGYDNDEFYRQLEARGFVVQPDGWSNYPATVQSMASTLNTTYLDHLAERLGRESEERRPLHDMIERHVVLDTVRRAGYRYLHLGGWWEPVRTNRYADEVYNGYRRIGLDGLWPTEFERVLWKGSPLPALWRPPEVGDCDRLKRQLHYLGSVGNGPRPVFAFAHLFIPHFPILLDADGECLERPIWYFNGDVDWETFRAAHVDYLRYFNRRFLDIVDRQLERRGADGRGLVVMLQSDEGPSPKSMLDDLMLGTIELGRRDLQWKLGNLNALRLPGADDLSPDELVTPINNWRLVFEALGGRPVERLPHRLFVNPAGKIYDLREVSYLMEMPLAAPAAP